MAGPGAARPGRGARPNFPSFNCVYRMLPTCDDMCQRAGSSFGFHPTGRGEARPSGRKAEPEHLERVWGVSGPVRIQEQNRTEVSTPEKTPTPTRPTLQTVNTVSPRTRGTRVSRVVQREGGARVVA